MLIQTTQKYYSQKDIFFLTFAQYLVWPSLLGEIDFLYSALWFWIPGISEKRIQQFNKFVSKHMANYHCVTTYVLFEEETRSQTIMIGQAKPTVTSHV